jgi:hypothetical protein
MPSPVDDGASSISGVHRDGTPDRAAAGARRPPGTLDLSIRRRGAVIELGLAGDLDMATAPAPRRSNGVAPLQPRPRGDHRDRH